MAEDYGFVVVHIPHASLEIPEEYRKTILLDELTLWREKCRMTDAFCDDLYDAPGFENRIVAENSRFVCDVERFRDDELEPCAKKGQGLMYTKTWVGKKLRENNQELRNKILEEIYDPHHERLTSAVELALSKYGKCLIIDGHSFHSKMIVKLGNIFGLPDFDFGTDSFHTPKGLVDAMCDFAKRSGYRPKVNTPFGGAITPMKFYQREKRVVSVMIETNRKLYMNEKNMTKNGGFQKTRAVCHELMRCAAEYVKEL